MVKIDIEMPTNCATCRLKHNIGCNIANSNGWNNKERDVRCPLKSLVQCKDCKLYQTKDCEMYYFAESTGYEGWPVEDGYCHMAEPK